MTLPLSNVRVVALTHYLQGPSCVQFLADLGADVIKVERIGGAYERHWSGAKSFSNDTSVFFLLAGRNQRSVEIDFSTEDGKEALWRLIESADVLVENFRAGTLDRRGFSYEAVKERNPRIIYCSLSGFGPEGPSKDKPGQDLLLQSLTGLAMLSGRAGDPPIPVGSAIVDQHAATLGALGVLAALLGRAQTGKGCRVDSNLMSAGLDLQLEPINYHLAGGRGLWERSASGVATRFHQAPYGVYKTADGWLTMSLSDGATLAAAFDDPQFAQWSREDQFDQREDVNTRVADHMIKRTTAEWEEIFDGHGVWYAEVRDYDQVLADPQLAANQSILEFDDPNAGPVRVLAHPICYDRKTPPLRRTPPLPGQHTAEVLKELGYPKEQIGSMRDAGVLGPDRDVVGFDRKTAAPKTSYSKRSAK
ncbi:MAG: CaiB/BaiF CoA-transferase family protein [Shinella sp.]|nr:CaiB/BaiF CoA-transferase family protein [Shinella sp.]